MAGAVVGRRRVWSTKTYTHDVGLSCCFRQHRASSHCRFLHGYALQVKITFGCELLDENCWVMDFGGLKDIKQRLVDLYDHKTVISEDDPYLDALQAIQTLGVIDLRITSYGTGCESFATEILDVIGPLIKSMTNGRVSVDVVEVSEHPANSAIVSRQT